MVSASGLNSRPLLGLQREDRQEGDRDDKETEEQRRSDFLGGAKDDLEVGPLSPVRLVVPVDVLDHDDRGVHEYADRDRDAPERHDVRAEALGPHDDEGKQDRNRNRQDRHQRGSEVEQEDEAHQRHDDGLLDQGVGERRDGAFDQAAAIVGHRDLDVVRHAAGQLGQPLLDPLDRRPGVGARTDDDDASHRLALAVPVGEAAPDLRSDRHIGDIAKQDGYAAGTGREDDRLQVAQFSHVAAPPHHVLALGQLNQASADIGVRLLDRPPHHRQREAVGP